MSGGSLPDLHLHALNKATDEKARIGAAWFNTDGSIRIKLNSWVVLFANPNLVLTLFPNRGKAPPSTDSTDSTGPTEADVPF